VSTLALRTQTAGERHPLWLLGAAALGWLALYKALLPFWDWLLYSALPIPQGPRWADALHFFLYDTTKILLLLTGIIFVARVLRSFLSIEPAPCSAANAKAPATSPPPASGSQHRSVPAAPSPPSSASSPPACPSGSRSPS
jgi:hypothetical protein